MKSVIDVFAMAKNDRQDHKFVVLDLADHAIVTGPISPEAIFFTAQRLSDGSGIAAPGETGL